MTDRDAIDSLQPIGQTGVGALKNSQSVSIARSSIHLPSPLVICTLLLITLLFGAIRYRLRSMPLERDEGEYAYSGQLMLQGIPPYQLAYNLKLPGIYAAYAVVLAVFGQTPTGIHLGLIAITAFSSLLMYFLASTLFGSMAGLGAAASFSLLAANPSVMGFEAHATHFVILAALCGILLLLQGLRSQTHWLFFASGFFCGIAFLMKQHGVFFALFCFCYLFLEQRRQLRPINQLAAGVIILAAGFLLPYVVTCALLYHLGVFHQFWFWTVTYAGEYSKMGLRRGVHAFLENYGAVLRANSVVWLVALVGLTAVLWNQHARRHLNFTAPFLLFSVVALCPGAYFRPHYFILLLPVAALLVGVAVAASIEAIAESEMRRFKYIPATVFAVVVALSVLAQHAFYFSLDPASAMKTTYGANPYFSAMKIGDYLRQHSPPAARIAVLGSEPEIYFYAQRHSATGYLYMYSLIVRQKYTDRMQQELMREVATNQPEYLVYVDVPDSWGEDRERAPQAYSFLAWLRQFSASNYEVTAVSRLDEPSIQAKTDTATVFASNTPAIYLLKRKTE